jgi:hypothetical protein
VTFTFTPFAVVNVLTLGEPVVLVFPEKLKVPGSHPPVLTVTVATAVPEQLASVVSVTVYDVVTVGETVIDGPVAPVFQV